MRKYIIAALMLAGVSSSYAAALDTGVSLDDIQIKAAIAIQLTVVHPDNSVQVIAMKAAPTALRYVYTFEAKTEETGFTGITQQFMVRGIYNLATDKLTVMEKILDESAKSATDKGSVRAALKKLLEVNQPDRSVEVMSLEVTPTYMGFLYSFKAEVRETGFTGIAAKRTLTGFYNTVKNTITLEK